ncbi:MAG: outer membrane protein assembly factor BamA, partial [Alphaproteobacteria bacterium]
MPASAQLPTIEEIRVEGNQRIEAETVRSHVRRELREGDFFDPQQIDRALKSLFATNLFADVNMRREGNVLVVRVVENPIINQLAFEGNQRIDDEALEAEVQLRPRVVYTRTKVKNDVTRILALYRRSGRFAATVEPRVIQQPENRVDLVFEIDEGPPTRVRKIIFIGNRRFSDSRLNDVIATKESPRWYRPSTWRQLITADDTYDPDRLSFDEDLLRRFYLSRGYADFRVRSVVAELTRDRRDFFITFTVEEGERYRFGKIDLDSRLRDLDESSLFASVKTFSGEWYNEDLVEETIQELTDAVGSLGFAFVDIRPLGSRDRESRTIAVTYEIAEGPRVYVERINIAGNVRTRDEVIRREFRLAEGDAFNTAKIRRSQQRIRNLDFFKTVDVTKQPGSSPDKTIMDVEVLDKPTGALSFGVGLSSIEGVLTDIRVSERNLLGRGQDLALGLSVSTRRQEIDLSFTEPYFLNRELSAGFDVFRRTVDRQDESSFDSRE